MIAHALRILTNREARARAAHAAARARHTRNRTCYRLPSGRAAAPRARQTHRSEDAPPNPRRLHLQLPATHARIVSGAWLRARTLFATVCLAQRARPRLESHAVVRRLDPPCYAETRRMAADNAARAPHRPTPSCKGGAWTRCGPGVAA